MGGFTGFVEVNGVGEVEEVTAVSKNVENNVERDGISSFRKKILWCIDGKN